MVITSFFYIPEMAKFDTLLQNGHASKQFFFITSRNNLRSSIIITAMDISDWNESDQEIP